MIEQAITLGAQAGDADNNATQNATLAAQVQGIQEQLVNLSNTNVNGRYIFSGDSDQQAAYAVDSTQPNGVQQVAPATSTAGDYRCQRQHAVDAHDGAADLRCAELRRHRTPPAMSSPPSTALLTALQNNDSSAATASVDSLKTADDYLNQQLGLIGIAENRVTDATTAASQSVTTEQQNLGTLRDADTAGDAVEVTQLNTQQQAALSARATMSQYNLFDFLA